MIVPDSPAPSYIHRQNPNKVIVPAVHLDCPPASLSAYRLLVLKDVLVYVSKAGSKIFAPIQKLSELAYPAFPRRLNHKIRQPAEVRTRLQLRTFHEVCRWHA